MAWTKAPGKFGQDTRSFHCSAHLLYLHLPGLHPRLRMEAASHTGGGLLNSTAPRQAGTLLGPIGEKQDFFFYRSRSTKSMDSFRGLPAPPPCASGLAKRTLAEADYCVLAAALCRCGCGAVGVLPKATWIWVFAAGGGWSWAGSADKEWRGG